MRPVRDPPHRWCHHVVDSAAAGHGKALAATVVRNIVLVLLYVLAIRTSLRVPPVDATGVPAHAPSPVDPAARQAS